jgi:hypothetical protein
MKKICTTTIERNGCRYHARRFGDQSEEHEHRRHERTGPASAQVGELGYWFGEQHLVGVALKIPENRGAENRGDDDDAEQTGKRVVQDVAEGPVQQYLAVGVGDRTESFRRDTEEREGEPDQEIDVG